MAMSSGYLPVAIFLRLDAFELEATRQVRFTDEVIPYQEHWKRMKDRIMIVVVAFSCSLLILAP